MLLALLTAAPASAGAPDETRPVRSRDGHVAGDVPSGVRRQAARPAEGTGYVYEMAATLKPGFQKTRAFYGCFDWHSSVNSTWTMVKILRAFPDLPVARLVREKLSEHLSADALKGEIEFFKADANKTFERPYGWAWLLRLHAELKSWDDPDAKKWTENLEPLRGLVPRADTAVPADTCGADARRDASELGVCAEAAERVRAADQRFVVEGGGRRTRQEVLRRRLRLRAERRAVRLRFLLALSGRGGADGRPAAAG